MMDNNNQNQVNPVSQETNQFKQKQVIQTDQTPEESNSNYWKIIAIISMVLLLLAVGVIVLLLNRNGDNTSNVTTSNSDLPNMSPTISKVQTNQYTNSTYGISFEYPSGWQVENDPQTYQNWDFVVNIDSSTHSEGSPEVIGQLYVWKQNNLQQFLQDPPEGGFQEFSKDGHTIYKAVEDRAGKYVITILFEKSGKVFQIAFTVDKNESFANNKNYVEGIIESLSLN